MLRRDFKKGQNNLCLRQGCLDGEEVDIVIKPDVVLHATIFLRNVTGLIENLVALRKLQELWKNFKKFKMSKSMVGEGIVSEGGNE